MRDEIVWGDTLPQAYHEALCSLANYGQQTPCPDYNTTQLECSMTMCVEHPLWEPMISKLFMGGFYELEQYRQEILDGILDFEIGKGNWKYTYHDRMAHYATHPCNPLDWYYRVEYVDQIQFVIDELKRNPSSRRAVIDIRDNNQDMYSDDPACLQHIQYFIRNDRLDCSVLFRSNDAVKATYMNAFALIMLQKRIADELGVEVGTYTHRANSFHCYKRDFDTLAGYTKRIEDEPEQDSSTLAYNYKGDWDELMEDCKPTIAGMVERLKEGKYDC